MLLMTMKWSIVNIYPKNWSIDIPYIYAIETTKK